MLRHTVGSIVENERAKQVYETPSVRDARPLGHPNRPVAIDEQGTPVSVDHYAAGSYLPPASQAHRTAH